VRKPVVITIIVLALALAIGITVLALNRDSAGTSDDPLVTRSYAAGEYSQQVISDAAAPIDSTLTGVYDAALATAQEASVPADTTAARTLAKGGVMDLGEGASVTMVSGAASIKISAGTVSDVTDGKAASGGEMAANHRYIVCAGGKAQVSVEKKAVFVTSGSVTVTGGTVPSSNFKDVKPTDWFHDYVVSAVESGLVNGTTPTTYSPNGSLTLAEAIKLAACMHQLYADGKVTLTADKDIWYMSYVRYAVSEGVIEGSYAGKTTKEYKSAVTRQEFAHIFYGALPESQYAAINSVADNAIPDVKSSSAYGSEIYAFYKAGILTGDSTGKFNPSSNIKRSEVAAIVARMMDSTLRQSVTLK
jgi:hypothetical protein